MAILHDLLSCRPDLVAEVVGRYALRGSSGGNVVAKLLHSTPSLLAALYYLSAPFFVRLTRRGYTDYAAKVDEEWQGPKYTPPHLEPKAVAESIDWMIDAPQVVPTLLLPLAAAVFAIRDSAISSIVLAFASIAISICAVWIYSISPMEYRTFRIPKTGHTLVAVLGIVLNTTAAILLFFL